MAGDGRRHAESILVLWLEEDGGPVGEVRSKNRSVATFTTCDLINAGCVKTSYVNEFCDRICMSMPYPEPELLSAKFRNLSKPALSM